MRRMFTGMIARRAPVRVVDIGAGGMRTARYCAQVAADRDDWRRMRQEEALPAGTIFVERSCEALSPT